MKPANLRLLLAVALFAGWIGWLVYLVRSSGATAAVVLSRPQFLVSSLDVIADVQEIDTDPAEVTIREVLWPTGKEAKELVHKEITVSRLSECRDDWVGPREYILPLARFGEKGYQVVPLPRSPGFPSGRPRIYPATPEARRQLQEIRKPEGLLLSVDRQAKAED